MSFDPTTTASIKNLAPGVTGSLALAAGAFVVRSSTTVFMADDAAFTSPTVVFVGQPAEITLASPATLFFKTLGSRDTTDIGISSMTSAASGVTVELFEGVGGENSFPGSYHTRNIASFGSWNFNMPTLPANFVSLVSIGVVGWPEAGATGAG